VRIGLFVARRFVALHGGTVHARGVHDSSGAEFLNKLPLKCRAGFSAMIAQRCRLSLYGERDAGYSLCRELRRLPPELSAVVFLPHHSERDRVYPLAG